MTRSESALLLASLLLSLTAAAGTAAERPNIVLLLVDDAGFMDFGGYGGEAATPNIDQLAERGVRFTNYHTSPLCAPSRAMLLTGLDSHRTGIGTIPEVLTEEQAGNPAYAMRLLPGVDTIADRLSAAGYQTFMTGKWHLGRGPGDLPDSHGFRRSFALDASGADNWEQKSYIPFYKEAPWFEDGQPADLPDDFYSSEFLVDRMIEYLQAGSDTSPFFAYIAFQAVHIPVQAPPEFTDRYTGVYSDGWHATLQRRFRRASELGLVPEGATIPAMHPSLRNWSDLTTQEQALYERSMMVNAGMLEAMDFHIGRLVEYLRATGKFDNTIFFVTSDNGPEFSDPATAASFRLWMSQNGYNRELDTLGERGSLVAIGPEWASAAAVPGSLFKFYTTEGGTRVPLIISGPGIDTRGFTNGLNFVTDIAPTIADLAGIAGDDRIDGRSLRPLLDSTADATYADEDIVAMEVAGNAAVFQGHHKLTRITLPHGDGHWRLYDLHRDPAESRDLSAELPQLRSQLLQAYARYAANVGVVELPEAFDITAQLSHNVLNRLLANNTWLAYLLAGLIWVLLFLLAYVVKRRRQAD